MDTEYRTMYTLFDGAVYEDFVFYCTRKTILAGKPDPGAHHSLHLNEPE
jgi:hypothetical protein